MFWEIADELYALSREVLKETNHNIHFEVNERSIHVWIEENGGANEPDLMEFTIFTRKKH